MKRALAILLVVVAAALAGACGDDASVVATAPTPTPTVTAAPVVTYFYSDQAKVSVSVPCTALRWDVTGDAATRVRIEPSIGDGMPMNGMRTVCPSVGTTYTLTATDSQGRKAYGTTTIYLSTTW